MSPKLAAPSTIAMPKNSNPFSRSGPPCAGKGSRNAITAQKLAKEMRNEIRAARRTSRPKIVMPSGRSIFEAPQGKEEQDGDRSGARRRAQITPTGLCHSSTSPLLPDETFARGHKNDSLRRGNDGAPEGQNVQARAGLAENVGVGVRGDGGSVTAPGRRR